MCYNINNSASAASASASFSEITMRTKRKIPIISLSLILIALILFIIYRIGRGSRAFSDLFESSISSHLRYLIGSLTNGLSFSLFEVLMLCLPVLIVAVIALAVIAFKRRRKALFLVRLCALASLILSLYVLTTGLSYHTTPVAEKIGLEVSDEITAEDIKDTASKIIAEINGLIDSLGYSDGQTRMDYSFGELSQKISEAYGGFNQEHRLFLDYASVAKPIRASGAMTSLRLSGIYTFYTGEANINMAYPDYCLPFTVAHELAHARGVMREDEANFVAFLVCIGSSDPYVRYSGYLNLLEYLMSALYKTDADMYNELLGLLDERVLSDLREASAVSKKYRNGLIGNLSNKLNDMYLKANGTAGTASYGMVTGLAVSYYKGSK